MDEFITLIYPQIINLGIKDFLLFGMTWNLLFLFISYYGFSSYVFDVGYFHLTSYYLLIRINRILDQFKKKMSENSLKSRLIRLNKFLKLIERYNHGCWSQIILVYCTLFSMVAVFMMYNVFFSHASYFLVVVYIFYMIFLSQFISIFILNASRIKSSIDRIYISLNQVNSKLKIRNISNKLKV
jgi:hypothetical protein